MTAQPDGTWRVDNILGGRFRVRAWRAPDLTMGNPTVFFLGASDTRTVALALVQEQGTVVRSSIAPRPPITNQPANLVVVVATKVVDGEGIVRAQPVVGAQVTLFSSGQWQVRTPNPTQTDPRGATAWQLVCGADGPQPLSVEVGTESLAVDVPPCVTPPPPTTEAPTSSTSTTSTSTPRKRGQASTTVGG